MKKSLLLLAGITTSVFAADAQQLGEGYVTFPESQDLGAYIRDWDGGNGSITINGKTWEDENFFVSRVKPRVRFYNKESQVYPFTQDDPANGTWGNDKRQIMWVPINDNTRNGVSVNALPNGSFDSEVFSMWSYIDHYGNWTAPFGWCPGAFADVAHKNGVAVSGVASVPYGGISPSWRSSLENFGNLASSYSDVGRFFLYHGVDGVGYNSEWSGWAPTTLISMHDKLKTYMADKNPLWEVIWYGGTTDGGGINFDRGVGSSGGNTKLFNGASIFLNYNWNSGTTMENSANYAKSVNRSPMFIYAGMNMQGGEPHYGDNYPILKDYQHSIGLWGAHSINMFWTDRNSKGSAPAVKQRTYLNMIERWFTNGPRNPAIKLEIKTNRAHRPTDDWAGTSSMMTARSTISWAIKDEPFYTFFNLGNGGYFNWKGVRQNDNEWYNIGVQDYLPTWRWWFSPTFMQKDVEAGTVSLAADFTWDDAYVGGSCLQISGSANEEYLQLFKTNLAVTKGNQLVLRYKLLEGSADVELVLANGKTPTEVAKGCNITVFTADKANDIIDNSYLNGWQTLTWDLTTGQATQLRSGAGNLGVIGLHFKNAKNLKLLLGEFGIYKDATSMMTTPAQPELTLCRVLTNNYKGVDGKLIWNMPNEKATGDPVYNSDVNTSMFRMWAQQEGEEPIMMGLTTSWAGIVFSAPLDPNGSNNIRFGVSALSMDLRSESEVTWSDYMDAGEYVGNDEILTDKSIIKPNEKFEMRYADPRHAEGTWVLSDAQTGVEQWRGEGHTVECPGLSEIGAYTLNLTCNGETKEYTRYIAVSSEGVGALPEIYSMAIDGKDVESVDGADVNINVGDSKNFSYTGRAADGSASRGIDLNECWFGVNVGELGIQANKSFSVAAWVKYNELPAGRSNFITIENRMAGGWPYNNWGFFWSRITDEGRFVHPNIDTAWGMRMGSGTEGQRLFYRYDESKIDVNAWTHVAIVFEYTEAGALRQKFYINGRQQKVGAWVYILKSTAEGIMGSSDGDWTQLEKCFTAAGTGRYGSDTYEPNYVPDNWPITSSDWIAFGGMAHEITAVKGCVDDFQVWGKAMTQEDVEASMTGLDKNNLPADVLGYWDFENDVTTFNYDFYGEKAHISGVGYQFLGYAGANATNKTPGACWYGMNEGQGEGSGMFNVELEPSFLSGCPFISGTAYPITTKPTWTAQRAQIEGDGTGEAGSANITFSKMGDYAVKLTLANGHGEQSKTYPVISVGNSSAIDNVAVDGEGVATYTIDDVLFVDFANDGNYAIEVYNMGGAMVGYKSVDAVAGQNAQISLGTAGVYLVKVTRDGQNVRTVKVIRK